MSDLIISQLPNVPLTDSELRRVPSIFSESAENSVSQKYSYISTKEILNKLDKEGWKPYYAKQTISHNKEMLPYQKHLIGLRHESFSFEEDSDFQPQLLLINSHNRSKAFQMNIGIYRFICSNGLTIGEDMFEPIKFKHIGIDEIDFDSVFHKVINGFNQSKEKIIEMKSVQLSHDEKMWFAEEVLKQNKKEDKILPEHLLLHRRKSDNKSDIWSVLNIIQENLIKGGLITKETREKIQEYNSGNTRVRPRITRTKKITSIDSDLKINRTIWNLASSLLFLQNQMS